MNFQKTISSDNIDLERSSFVKQSPSQDILSCPTQKKLASFAQFQELLLAIVNQRLPDNISKIEISCIHLFTIASLTLKTTDKQGITTSVYHETRKRLFHDSNTQTLNHTVFECLGMRSERYSSASDITSLNLDNLARGILQISTLSEEDTYNVGNIGLGQLPGKITFEEPKKLTIKRF